MPNIPKVCPMVRGLKVSHYTVKKWELLHDSLDLPAPTAESVELSVLGAVTHKDTQNDHIPRNPQGEIHSLTGQTCFTEIQVWPQNSFVRVVFVTSSAELCES